MLPSKNSFSGFFIFIFLFVVSGNNYAQKLTVEEAIMFLNNVVNQDLIKQSIPNNGAKTFDMQLIDEMLHLRYYWKNNSEALNPDAVDYGLDYNEIVFSPISIGEVFMTEYRTKRAVGLRCSDKTKNCFQNLEESIKINYALEFVDRPTAKNHFDYLHMVYLKDPLAQYKAYVATNYIINVLQEKWGTSVASEIASLSGLKKNKEIIDLDLGNGVFYITAILGETYKVQFVLDSGASDVSITSELENLLLDKNIINESSYLAPALYGIADGNVIESRRFVIPSLRINNTEVTNVVCSVNNSKSVLLLGQSFLDRFDSWTIDNNTNQLILEY